MIRTHSTCRRRHGAGFTLVELMTTITVAAVLLALAAPSFSQFQRNSQLTAAANTFLSSLAAARAEAMKRQMNAFVRPADNTAWTSGWASYVDVNWNGTYAAGDVPITQQDPLPSTVSLSSGSDTTPSDGTSHYVAFSGAGYLLNLSTGAPLTQASVGFTNGTETRLVIMNAAGRMRVCNPARDTTCTTSNAF